MRRATFSSVGNADAPATQLKVWAHRVAPEGDSEGISGILQVRQDGETRQFDLKLSKGQVVVPVSPGDCQVEIRLG